jgi:hypothetical protein
MIKVVLHFKPYIPVFYFNFFDLGKAAFGATQVQSRFELQFPNLNWAKPSWQLPRSLSLFRRAAIKKVD